MKKDELVKRIREERKRLGLSIEEVVDKTKLHPFVIKSIEEGKWERINPTYLKGFLKIYCSFLKIEFEEEIIEKSNKKKEEKRIKEPTPQEYVLKKEIFKERLVEIGRFLSFYYKFFVIFIFLFVGLVFLVKFRKTSHYKEIPAKLVVPSSDKVEVTFRIKKDCFVKVRADGDLIFEGVLKKGMVESWEAKELEFWISDGSAVAVEVNGKLLPPLTRLSKPIKSLKIKKGTISVIK